MKIFLIAMLGLLVLVWVFIIAYSTSYNYVDTFCFVVNNIKFNDRYLTILKDINTGNEYNIINDKELYQNVANWKVVKIRAKEYLSKARYYEEFVGAVE
jgi:hypothetical protein